MTISVAAILFLAFSWLNLTSAPPEGKKAGADKKDQPIDLNLGGVTGPVGEPKMSPFFRQLLLRGLDEFQQGTLLRNPPIEDVLAVRPELHSVYLALHVEFTTPQACQDFQLKGADVFTRIDRFADMFLNKKETLLALEKAPGVRWIDFAQGVQVPPPSTAEAAEKTRELAEEIVRGGINVPLTGKGVLVAVIDSGIDFRHPDFITLDRDGKPVSRLLYFWDTLSDSTSRLAAPVRYPNGKHIGAVYDNDDLNAALRGETYIPVWDNQSHGTGCASIAAGNGRAATGEIKAAHLSTGVAPEADLIAIRIGGAGRGMETGYLLGVFCDWIKQKAKEAKKPYVITCSWGNAIEFGHDGNGVMERQLDVRFPLDGPDSKGKAICFAAGNAGHWRTHAFVECRPGQEKAKLTWFASEPGRMTIYFDSKNAKDVRIAGESLKQVQTYVHPLIGTVVSEIDFDKTRNLQDELTLASASGTALKADAFLRTDFDGQRGNKTRFVGECLQRTMQLDHPGSAHNVITVGSYDWNTKFHKRGQFQDYKDPFREPIQLGALSRYSSHGPSRAPGIVKPDVVAPGQYFTAAAPSNVDVYRDSSGRYRLFNGTSAATPYVAGVIALMLQKNPDLTFGQVHELLHGKAVRDEHTGPTPNAEWGYGKLNKKAVLDILDAIPAKKG